MTFSERAGACARLPAGFVDPPDDLSALTLIDPAAVRDLIEQINVLDDAALSGRKMVVALATGGTLAMVSMGGVRAPALELDQLLTKIDPHLSDRFVVRGMNAFNIDSSQMDYRHTRDLAIAITFIWKNINKPFLGFLITHGTDTMAFAGAALSLMMGPGLPFSIVYTGSQRPIIDPLSDAGQNIRHALYTLESLYAHDMAEVLIVMGDRALLATSAEKVDDLRSNAFDSPRHRYVVDYTRLQYPVPLAPWLNPRRQLPFTPMIWQGDYSHSLVITSALGQNPNMIGAEVDHPAVRAVILYTYGSGTVYEGVLDRLVPRAKAKGIPVFVVNPVHSDYKVEYQSSAKAIALGAVPLDMTLAAALAKAEIALRLHAGNMDALCRFMHDNYVGEIPQNEARFVPQK